MQHANDAPAAHAFGAECADMGGLPPDLRSALVAAREQRGWSQQELGDLAHVTRSTVYRTEHGLTVPRADNLAALLKQLDLPLELAMSITSTRVSSPDTGAQESDAPGGLMALPDSAITRLLHYCLSLTEDEAARALAALRRLLREDADPR